MVAQVLFGEALALGLASGPACVAACGPVLIPSLLTERAGLGANFRTVTIFMGGRLLGYMLFAILAWEFGVLVSLLRAPRLPMIGAVYVLLAGVLIWYAYSARRECAGACAGSKLVNINEKATGEMPSGAPVSRGFGGPAALGFLTGLNLCPPFVVAGVRAAGLGSAAQALLFFTFFFAGTSIWFVPFAGLGCFKRNQAVITVARMAMGIIAVYYLLMGIVMLLGRSGYGY
ncbi:MAG TPA: sulfite exporter TauE/SafE family protein [Terracidiphilus sp.]|nr:sulfite exporter TauE/SafE family protein [Terracidiphilus sp.]